MVYYKLILNDKRFKEDQIYPIVIRISYNRSNTTLTTGIRIKKDDWHSALGQVRKTNPNFQALNKAIIEFYLKVQKVVHLLQDSNEFSFDLLNKKLSEQIKPCKINTSVSFNEFSQKLIQDQFAINRSGNAIVYRTASNRLINYAGGKTIRFKDIDYLLLRVSRAPL